MNRKQFLHLLVDRDKKLADVHREAAIPYGRLVRIVNGYSKPTNAELARIATILDTDISVLAGEGSA